MSDVLSRDFDQEREVASAAAVKADRATAQAFTAVFSTADGQRVLALLDKFCFVKHTTFTPESRDAIVFHEGMRNVALWVHSWLEYEKSLEKHSVG